MSVNPAVYVARNLVTNKVYVGSSINAVTRIRDHKRNLVKGIHSNQHLQQAWDKVGSTNFVWEVVETCSRKELLKLELEWILRLKANEIKFGYNKAFPVEGLFPSRRMTAIHKKYWSSLTDEERAERVSHLTDPSKNPKIISEAITAKWRDPEFRAARLEGLARGRAKTNANLSEAHKSILKYGRSLAIKGNKTPEGRKRQRANNLAQWKDPVIRAKRLAALAQGRMTQHLRALKNRNAGNDIV